ncbi:hypothetical protein JCM15831A_26420 [Asaia astilbis]
MADGDPGKPDVRADRETVDLVEHRVQRIAIMTTLAAAEHGEGKQGCKSGENQKTGRQLEKVATGAHARQ